MSMRLRLNGRYFLVLLGVVALLGGSVYALHGRQMVRIAGSLRSRAEQAAKENRPVDALDYLSRYLAYRPGDAGAWADYGLTLARRARTAKAREQAFLTLERALRLDPTRDDARREAARLAVSLARDRSESIPDARAHLRVLLRPVHAGERKPRPGDGELEQWLGECSEIEGRFADAARSYQRAITLAPARIEPYDALARLLRVRLAESDWAREEQRGLLTELAGSYQEDGLPARIRPLVERGTPTAIAEARAALADGVMDRLVASHPRSTSAYLARSRYRQAHHLDGAAADLASARKLAPEDADVTLASAAEARSRGNLDEAKGYLESGVARHPSEPRMSLELAALEMQAGRPSAAAARARRGLKAMPGEVRLQLALEEALLLAGELEEAKAVFDRLRPADVPPGMVDYFRARFCLAEGKWTEAAETLEHARPLLARWPDLADQADLALARCYERLDAPDRRYAALRRAVDATPSSTAARLGLAATLEAMGRIDNALAEYLKVRPGSPEAAVAVARLQILRNLRAPVDRRRWQDVESALDEAGRSAGDDPRVPILRAEFLVARGKFDEARDVLAGARRERPDRVELWLAGATLAERRGDPGGVLPLLDEARRRLGDRVELRLARADYWTARGGAEARSALAELGEHLGAISAEDRIRLLAGLADACTRIGDQAGARRYLGLVAADRPNDLDSRRHLFELALQLGDDEAMGRTLAEIRRIEDHEGMREREGTLWRYLRARQLMRKSVPAAKAEARALLAFVAARRPAWPEVHRAEALIEEEAGNREAAIAGFLRAIDLGARDPDTVLRVIQLLYDRQRYLEADQLLRELEGEVALPGGLHHLASQISLRNRDYRRAVDLARKAVVARPDDARDRLWLGQVLAASGNSREAEAEFRRATDLAAGMPDPWVALAQLLARTGQVEKAEATIEDARRRIDAGLAPLAIAQCFEAIGRNDRAAALYREALSAHPEDVPTLRSAASFALRTGRPTDAEPLLRKIIDLKVAREDSAWARRVLALALSMGNPRQARDALAVLGLLDSQDSVATPGETPEDLHAKARVLASQDSRRQRLRAIPILEGLASRQPLSAEDQFLLARLYESARGDWPNAHKQMVALLASGGDKPVYVASFVNSLVRRAEADEAHRTELLAEARPWLARLEELDPDGFRTLVLKALVHRASGRAAEATELILAYSRRVDAPLERLATLLEELGQPGPAEDLYRQVVARSGRPEASLALARFLGRRNRVSEALDLCEPAWSTSPAAVADASLAVLAASRPDDAQFRRVESRLNEALRNEPQSASLIFSLAGLRKLQGRFGEAVALYRQLVGRDGHNAPALNNLAYLLALEGQGGPALDFITRAIDIEGPRPALLDTRALIRLRDGKYIQAIEDLEEAIATSPSATSYFHLAQAYQEAGTPAASNALHKARALGLSADDLHPAERNALDRLIGTLALRPPPRD